MSHDEDAHDRSLLLAELRCGDHVDAESLARIRERVSSTLTQQHLTAIGGSPRSVSRPVARRRAAWGGLAAALMVGSALGAGGHALVSSYWVPQRQLVAPPWQRPHAPEPVARSSSLPVLSAAAPLAQMPEPAPAPEPPAPPRIKPRASPPPAPPAKADPGIAAELTKLEQARRALAVGNTSEALDVLARERALRPSSMLAQEREVLTIKALVKAGHFEEARAAGHGFLTRYPNSALAGAVQGALAAIP